MQSSLDCIKPMQIQGLYALGGESRLVFNGGAKRAVARTLSPLLNQLMDYFRSTDTEDQLWSPRRISDMGIKL